MKPLIDDPYAISAKFARKAASLWDSDRNASQEATDAANLMRDAARALQEKSPKTMDETLL
jgi:hypothetical protein